MSGSHKKQMLTLLLLVLLLKEENNFFCYCYFYWWCPCCCKLSGGGRGGWAARAARGISGHVIRPRKAASSRTSTLPISLLFICPTSLVFGAVIGVIVFVIGVDLVKFCLHQLCTNWSKHILLILSSFS